jgi:hypothetical protein
MKTRKMSPDPGLRGRARCLHYGVASTKWRVAIARKKAVQQYPLTSGEDGTVGTPQRARRCGLA